MRRLSLVGLAASLILSRALATAADNPCDAQTSHIAHTDGDLDIKIAQPALKKPEYERVCKFSSNDQ